MPIAYTGYGADLSPELHLTGLTPNAVSIAILMDDLDHPIPAYSHWVIWNLPAKAVIPGSIPPGETVPALGSAMQGRGYGKHRYRGPKPPFNWSHIYQFNVFVLDCTLTLPSSAKKRDVYSAMQGHILQQASLTGHYR